MSLQPAFQGEVMLAGWSETHNGGAKVTFWLQDESDLAAFKAMTVAKGKTAGQRLAIVAVEIGDDEQPKQPANDEEPAQSVTLRVLAVNLCKLPKFQEFLEVGSEEEAKNFILAVCGIDSRKELDTNVTAAHIFENIRKDFRAFVEGRK